MEENTDKTVKKQGQFAKDDPRINREGRPKGSRDFATDFDEVVDDLAKENNMTKSDVRKILLKVAYKNAKEGNYSFYKDIHDRLYGTAPNKLDITTKGQSLNSLKELSDDELINISTGGETGTSQEGTGEETPA